MIHTIGKHVVRHGDLMSGYEELIHPQVDWVNSDPPWGDGNIKYWETMNRKMNPNAGTTKTFDTESFLAKFFGVIRASCKPTAMVFLAYGMRWEKVVVRHAESINLKVLVATTANYGSKSLPLLHLTMAFQERAIHEGYAKSINGTKAMKTILAATGPFGMSPGQSILDPCCGLGYTARLAVHHGMTFYGNELNAKRLESTLKILREDKAK